MVTTYKKLRAQEWTWSGNGFTRQTPSEKQLAAPKPSLVYKRARYYDPQTGEFISRDPLGYVDGMSLYRGYFVPRHADPYGLKACADKCCCCVESLGLIDPKAYGPVGAKNEFGHKFRVEAELDWSTKSKEKKECTLKWEEWATYFGQEVIDAGGKDGQWNDLYSLVPDALVFGQWNNQVKICGQPEIVVMLDEPSITFKNPKRILKFRITVSSAEGCNCKKKSITVTGVQALKHDGKKIVTQRFDQGSTELPKSFLATW